MPIIPATRAEQLADVRALFVEYAESMEHHICFKNFQHELADLPGAYAPPDGGIWLAVEDNSVIGCIALRPLEGQPGTGEVKRLYVRAQQRGKRTREALLRTLITTARQIGYGRLWLDTLPEMKPAHAVYRRCGFQRIPNAHPENGAWCFDLALKPAGP